MLIDLKAHYLDLIVTALEAHKLECLHRPGSSAEFGDIYVSNGKGSTRTVMTVSYGFEEKAFAIGVEFADERQPIRFGAPYVAGLDDFFPKLSKAIAGNRLEYKPAKEATATA